MSWLVRSAVVAALLAVALLAAGCGETVIDTAKIEATLEENFEKSQEEKVSSVDCPSGVEVEKGNTFDCTVRLPGGKREIVSLKILNSDADVEVTNRQPDK